MAVMIDGMDMPKSCCVCPVSGTGVCRKWMDLKRNELREKRAEDCPIHEVKTGRWVLDEYAVPMCDKCGCKPWFGYVPALDDVERKFKYCPNCGSKMKEGE